MEGLSFPPDLCYEIASLKQSNAAETGARLVGERCFPQTLFCGCRIVSMDKRYIKEHFFKDEDSKVADSRPSDLSVFSWSDAQLRSGRQLVSHFDDTQRGADSKDGMSREHVMGAIDSMGDSESMAAMVKGKLDSHRVVTAKLKCEEMADAMADGSPVEAESAVAVRDSVVGRGSFGGGAVDDYGIASHMIASDSGIGVGLSRAERERMCRTDPRWFKLPKLSDVHPYETLSVKESNILELTNMVPFQICISKTHFHLDVFTPRRLKARRRHSSTAKDQLLEDLSQGESDEQKEKLSAFYSHFLSAHEQELERRMQLHLRRTVNIEGRYSLPLETLDCFNVFCEGTRLVFTSVIPTAKAKYRVKVFGDETALRVLWLTLTESSLLRALVLPTHVTCRTDMLFVRMILSVYDCYYSDLYTDTAKSVIISKGKGKTAASGRSLEDICESSAVEAVAIESGAVAESSSDSGGSKKKKTVYAANGNVLLDDSIVKVEKQWSASYGRRDKLAPKMQNKLFRVVETHLNAYTSDGFEGFRLDEMATDDAEKRLEAFRKEDAYEDQMWMDMFREMDEAREKAAKKAADKRKKAERDRFKVTREREEAATKMRDWRRASATRSTQRPLEDKSRVTDEDSESEEDDFESDSANSSESEYETDSDSEEDEKDASDSCSDSSADSETESDSSQSSSS